VEIKVRRQPAIADEGAPGLDRLAEGHAALPGENFARIFLKD
jgi:hypothetical protein